MYHLYLNGGALIHNKLVKAQLSSTRKSKSWRGKKRRNHLRRALPLTLCEEDGEHHLSAIFLRFTQPEKVTSHHTPRLPSALLPLTHTHTRVSVVAKRGHLHRVSVVNDTEAEKTWLMAQGRTRHTPSFKSLPTPPCHQPPKPCPRCEGPVCKI